jgi:hypothetical protein
MPSALIENACEGLGFGCKLPLDKFCSINSLQRVFCIVITVQSIQKNRVGVEEQGFLLIFSECW